MSTSEPDKIQADANLKYADRKQKKAVAKQNYIPQLILSIFLVLTYIAATITTVVLVIDWLMNKTDTRDLMAPGGLIIACYLWKTLHQIIINFFSTGPTALVFSFLDILQIREVYTWVVYVAHWTKHHGKTTPWKRVYYLPHQPYVSTLVSFPSLVLQAYAMIKYSDDIRGLQVVTIIFCAIHCFLEQITSFHYLSVSPRIYNFMLLLSVLSQSFRIIVIAFLIYTIKVYALIFWAASYIFGILLIARLFNLRRKRERDDPLQLLFVKILYTHQLAFHLTFVSTPFAVQHSVFEWWWGYILGEAKMCFEFGVALGLIALLYPLQRHAGFYVLYALGLAAIIIHMAALFFINMGVSRSLRRRSLFSTTKIVTFFVYFGNWIQEKYLGRQADGGLDDDNSSTAKLNNNNNSNNHTPSSPTAKPSLIGMTSIADAPRETGESDCMTSMKQEQQYEERFQTRSKKPNLSLLAQTSGPAEHRQQHDDQQGIEMTNTHQQEHQQEPEQHHHHHQQQSQPDQQKSAPVDDLPSVTDFNALLQDPGYSY